MPNNQSINNIKPFNQSINNIKSQNNSVGGATAIYTDSSTIFVGQPMGLLLALTYPITFSFTNTRL